MILDPANKAATVRAVEDEFREALLRQPVVADAGRGVVGVVAQ